jgi:hypothetical protein
MRALLVASVIGLTFAGCITHLPVRSTTHMQIAWRAGWDDAAREAARTGKPILAVLAAGEIAGLC